MKVSTKLSEMIFVKVRVILGIDLGLIIGLHLIQT